MKYKGYKITVSCIDWEQVRVLEQYWELFTSYVEYDKIVGLGYNWVDYKYFDYAIGVIDDEETLNKIKSIDFSTSKFSTQYIEIDLPRVEEWKSFSGKEEDLQKIYIEDIDCNEKKYDYELEYFDGKGNTEIKIHYQS